MYRLISVLCVATGFLTVLALSVQPTEAQTKVTSTVSPAGDDNYLASRAADPASRSGIRSDLLAGQWAPQEVLSTQQVTRTRTYVRAINIYEKVAVRTALEHQRRVEARRERRQAARQDARAAAAAEAAAAQQQQESTPAPPESPSTSSGGSVSVSGLPSPWDALAACESGGDPTVISSNGLWYGLFQFTIGTWQSVGGTGLPSDASVSEQLMRAQALQARDGWFPWPNCARMVGLL